MSLSRSQVSLISHLATEKKSLSKPIKCAQHSRLTRVHLDSNVNVLRIPGWDKNVKFLINISHYMHINEPSRVCTRLHMAIIPPAKQASSSQVCLVCESSRPFYFFIPSVMSIVVKWLDGKVSVVTWQPISEHWRSRARALRSNGGDRKTTGELCLAMQTRTRVEWICTYACAAREPDNRNSNSKWNIDGMKEKKIWIKESKRVQGEFLQETIYL